MSAASERAAIFSPMKEWFETPLTSRHHESFALSNDFALSGSLSWFERASLFRQCKKSKISCLQSERDAFSRAARNPRFLAPSRNGDSEAAKPWFERRRRRLSSSRNGEVVSGDLGPLARQGRAKKPFRTTSRRLQAIPKELPESVRDRTAVVRVGRPRATVSGRLSERRYYPERPTATPIHTRSGRHPPSTATF